MDGKKKNKKTPAFFKHITPGGYTLRLEKDGYLPWEKTLTVRARLTTLEKDILLFLKTSPTMVQPLDHNPISVSPSGTEIAYVVLADPWKEVWTYDLKNASPFLLDRVPIGEEISSFLPWDLPSTHLELGFAQGAFILQKGEDTTTLLRLSPGAEEEKIALFDGKGYQFVSWHDPYVLIQEKQNGTFALVDTKAEETPLLLQTHASLFAWEDERLFWSDGFELHRFDPALTRDTLMTRFGEPLVALLPLEEGGVLLVAFRDRVQALYTEDLNALVSLELFPADEMEFLWADEKQKTVFVFGRLDGKRGIFSYPLVR
jgi:hypothetical protein